MEIIVGKNYIEELKNNKFIYRDITLNEESGQIKIFYWYLGKEYIIDGDTFKEEY